MAHAIARVAASIDEMLDERWDRIALQMIEDGVDADGTVDDDDRHRHGWTRTTFPRGTRSHRSRMACRDPARIRAGLEDTSGWTPIH